MNEIHSAIESLFIDLFGITEWDSISFSMLPEDASKGYFQINEVQPGNAVNTTEWLVGIGVSDSTLDGLWEQVYGYLDIIKSQLMNRQQCLGNGVAKATLVNVSIPDSYTNNSHLTSAQGFKTAIAFNLIVEVPS